MRGFANATAANAVIQVSGSKCLYKRQISEVYLSTVVLNLGDVTFWISDRTVGPIRSSPVLPAGNPSVYLLLFGGCCREKSVLFLSKLTISNNTLLFLSSGPAGPLTCGPLMFLQRHELKRLVQVVTGETCWEKDPTVSVEHFSLQG